MWLSWKFTRCNNALGLGAAQAAGPGIFAPKLARQRNAFFAIKIRTKAIQANRKISFGGRRVLLLLLSVASGLALPVLVYAQCQAGALDTSFNGTGKATTPIGTNYDEAFGVAIQSDGKIVVGGFGVIGSGGDFAVVRYTSDGMLDPSFNGTGKVTTPIGSGIDQGYSVAIQSDGKIVLAGFALLPGSDNDFAVVRYNSNGSLDSSFNGTGKVTTPIGNADASDSGRAVAIQSDGKIVMTGNSGSGSDRDFAVVRYHPDGILDSSFNGTGKVTTSIGSGQDTGSSVAIQSDGKIVVAGATANGFSSDFALVRYNTHGSLDSSFNGTGIVVTNLGSFDVGNSVTIQSDGKIVVAGYSNLNGNHDFAVVRYNTNGDWTHRLMARA